MTTIIDSAATSDRIARRSLLGDIRSVWMRETLTILRDPFSLIFSSSSHWCSWGCSARFCQVSPVRTGSVSARRCSSSCPVSWS